MAESNQGKTKNIIIALLVLAVVVVGYFLTKSSGEVNNLEAERNNLITELDQMRSELKALEGVKQENDSMAVYITAETDRLTAMIEELKQEKDFNQKKYEEYRSRTAKLQQQNKELVATVDSINRAYQALQIEKEEVEDNLQEEVVKNTELTDENRVLKKDVAVGSMLQLSKLSTASYKLKGSGKEKETSSAASTDRIKTCFTIAKNLIANKGERVVYVRINTPDLKVITAQGEENKSFSFNGQPLFYSGKQTIYYNQDILEGCVNVDKTSDFVAGEYTIEVYTEGYKLGESKLTLK